jgi:hypothetical protein
MQSSIKSFFSKPRPTPHSLPNIPCVIRATTKLEPNDSTPDTEGETSIVSTDVTDYQRIREENIRRNSDFLAQLGLHEVLVPAPNERVSKKRTLNQTKPKTQPPKRVQPKRGVKCNDIIAPAIDSVDSASDSGAEVEELPFEDSSVLKYVISASEQLPSSPRQCSQEGEDSIPTLRPLPSLRCDALLAVYSMHPHPSIPSLLVTAGKGGFAAIFSIPSNSPAPEPSQGDSHAPLLHFKAHSRWISSARFYSSGEATATATPETTAIRLLTTADDGLLKLWDLARCNQNADPQLLSSVSLHERGIFAMDESGGKVLTGSKDRSVSLSAVHLSGEIRRTQQFEELHGSVVKSVHWKPVEESSDPSPVIFASGSQDSSIAVQDIRSPAPSLRIASAHAGGVHTVSWSPLVGSSGGSAEYLLLSAGYDSAVKLYDIRHCTSASTTPFPLHTFHDPRHASSRSSTIVTPSFLTSRTLLIPHESSSSLSINCTTTGKTLSRGILDEQPLSVVCSLRSDGVPDYAFAACKRKGTVIPLTILWTEPCDQL